MKYTKITIAGKICTGKTTLLEKLEKKLGWPTFKTGQLFRDYVIKHKLNLNEAQEQSEILTKQVDGQVEEMLKQDNHLIIDGWMSGISANKLKNVFKVLLVCKDDVRYKRYARREKLSLTEAKFKVEERQSSWFEKIEKIHNIKHSEFSKKQNYNLVIDTSVTSPSEVMKNVLSKMNQTSI